MVDTTIEKMARTICEYCTEIQEGETVFIQSTTLAVPLIEAIYAECIKKGAHPEISLRSGNMQNLFFTHAQEHQLNYCSPIMMHIVETVDVIITILADFNVKQFSNVDSKKLAQRSKAHQSISKTILERTYMGEMRWNLAAFPTHALAQEASMSLLEYENFVYKACFLDNPDPVAEWKALSKKQEKIVEYLNDKSILHIVGEDTDITMEIKGRTWINSDGKRNFPSGEVFTGPVETSAEGTIRFTFPGIYMGNEIEDISLTFEKGMVTKASAQRGDALLQDMLSIDEGARRIGEIAVGTNYGIDRFTKNILFDEKIGGTIHLALGRSMPDSGGKNQSAIHWDLLKDMKEEGKLYADGELFYEKGAFLI
jgi:aminopeptidase